MKKIIGLAFLLFIGLSTTLAQKGEIFTVNGKAIRGFDVVAFFTDSKPIQGNDSLSYTWKDAIWHFSSKENLEAFKKTPEKYAPQYGGYCAYGMSGGYKAPTVTETWTILNNKLYFNYSLKVQESWNKDQAGYIQKADANWEKQRNQ